MDNNKNKKINLTNWLKGIFLLFFVSALLISWSTARASAASFSFSDSSESYHTGDSISVSVYVNSPDQSINAISGSISFPSDKLSVYSISKNNSIVSIWVQDPTYSNAGGLVNFQGIILNPGFNGNNGNVITINFKAKAPGIALVSFATGSILANNGQGTNVIDSNGLPSAQYAIDVPAAAGGNQNVSALSISSGPLAPIISSLTHPDPTKWYSSNDVKLSWQITSDVDAVRTVLSNSPYSIPNILYQPPINQEELTGLADGVWYFGVRLHDLNGWGGVAYFKLQIDTTPPDSFSFGVASSSDPTNPTPTIILKATDKTSGIAYYEIKIDNQNSFTISPNKLTNYQYILPPQQYGRHTILAQAFDWAGNYRSASSSFDIQPMSPPIITYYTPSLTQNDILFVKGMTTPESIVTVWLEGEGKLSQSFKDSSDKNGNFIVIGTGLGLGQYKLWAESTDSRGAHSLPTKKYNVLVSQEFVRIDDITISWPVALILLVILFTLFYVVVRYVKNKIFTKKAGQESRLDGDKHLNKNTVRNFEILKKDIEKYDHLIEKSKKTGIMTEEGELLWQIKNDLERFEESIRDDSGHSQ